MPRTAYEYELPSGKRVVVVEPTVHDVLQAQKAGDETTLLANLIREIDGEKVDYSSLRGTGLSDRLSTKDLMIVSMMIADLTVPSEDEVKLAKGSKRVVAS